MCVSSLVALPVSSVSVIATYPRECVSLKESHRGCTDHLTYWVAILGNGYLAHCLHFSHEVALMLGFMATVLKAAIHTTAYPSHCPSPSLAHSLLSASWDRLPNKRLAPKSLFTVRQREGMMQGYIRIVTRTPRVWRRGLRSLICCPGRQWTEPDRKCRSRLPDGFCECLQVPPLPLPITSVPTEHSWTLSQDTGKASGG